MYELTMEKIQELQNLSLEHFNKAKVNCPFIDLNEEDEKEIDRLAKYAAEVAAEEDRMQKDSNAFYNRFYSGFVGEFAVSKYFGVTKLFKGCYPGGSYTNDAVDLGYLGLNMGIKCSKVGSVVKVAFKERFPQIICQYKKLSEWKDNREVSYIRVYFMGILKPEYIEFYCKRDYIDDINVLKKGSKGGFFEFEKLVPFSKEALSQYKSKVRIHNYLANGLSEMAVNLAKTSCIYFEKEKGYEVCAKPMPAIEGSKFKYHIMNKDFRGISAEDQEAFFEILSKRIVVGYGITGYLNTLQDRYTGEKEFNIYYIDLDDIIRKSGPNGLEVSAKISAAWVNRLYAWIDYLKEQNNLPKSRTEDFYDWHYRLCIDYIESMYKKFKSNKVA